MLSGCAWATTSIWSMRPWQVAQPTPARDVRPVVEVARSRAGCAPAPSGSGGRSTSLSRITASVARVALDHAVAVHAHLGRRHHGDRRAVDGGVAVEAVDAEVAGVELVAVGDRLHRLVADVGVARREVVPDAADRERRNHGAAGRDAQRQLVGPAREDLRHALSVPGDDRSSFSARPPLEAHANRTSRVEKRSVHRCALCICCD